MALNYFAPTIVYSIVLALAHGPGGTDVALAVPGALIVSGAIGALLFAVCKRFSSAVVVKQDGRGVEFVNLDAGSMYMETFGQLFDGARNAFLATRLYVFEELLVSIVLNVLSAIRPRSGACGPIALSMSVVCAVHVVYLLVVRPYRSRLELLLAITGAVLLQAISIVAVILTFGTSTEALQKALGILVLSESALFFLQTALLGFVAFAKAHRKRMQRQYDAVDGTDDTTLDVPMLDRDANVATGAQQVVVDSSGFWATQQPVAPLNSPDVRIAITMNPARGINPLQREEG